MIRVCVVTCLHHRPCANNSKGVFGNVIISENFLETFGTSIRDLTTCMPDTHRDLTRPSISKYARHNDICLQYWLLLWRSQHYLDGRLAGKTEANPPRLYGDCSRRYHSDGVLECSSGGLFMSVKGRLDNVADISVDDGREGRGRSRHWYEHCYCRCMSSSSPSFPGR